MSEPFRLPTEPTKAHRELWERSLLVYGIPKIGKTTFAAGFPNPYFLFTEDGSGELELHQTTIEDRVKRTAVGPTEFKEEFIGLSGWETAKSAIYQLATTKHNFQTVIVDTVPLFWLCAVRYHTVLHGVEHENDGVFGYGKGLAIITRDFTETLGHLHRLPMGKIFIAHGMEKEYEVAGSKTKRTRIVPNMPDRALNIVNGMVDMILFATYENGQRVLKTKGGHNYDAGTRIAKLPETIPLSYEGLAAAYTASTNGTGNTNAKVEIIKRCRKGEALLSQNKIDGFDADVRLRNARVKHAGNDDLTACDLSQLESYLQYLMTKYKEGTEANGVANT